MNKIPYLSRVFQQEKQLKYDWMNKQIVLGGREHVWIWKNNTFYLWTILRSECVLEKPKTSVFPPIVSSKPRMRSRFAALSDPISSPEPTLPLSSGTGNGRSGRIQNRNQKILVPVWLRLREVSGQNGGCWSCQHVQQDQFRAVSRGDSTVIDQQSENSHIHAVEANLWAISFV